MDKSNPLPSPDRLEAADPIPWGSYAGLAAYVFGTMLVCGMLLVVNAAITYSFYSGIHRQLPDWCDVTAIWQLVMFVVPTVLLFLEWMLWDTLSDYFRRRR